MIYPNDPSINNRYGEVVRFQSFPPKKRQAGKALKGIEASLRSKNQLSILSLSNHQIACTLHLLGEYRPFDQWPNPLLQGSSK